MTHKKIQLYRCNAASETYVLGVGPYTKLITQSYLGKYLLQSKILAVVGSYQRD